MSLKIGVLRFPGTNCGRDVFKAVEGAGHQPQWLWHQDRFNPAELDAFIVPGGFSYGDYLRSGALAARAPVMDSLREAAEMGKPVLGICNGFQILTEARLLPGALLRNQGHRFIDDWVDLKVENTSPFFGGQQTPAGKNVRLPIAHADGRYFASDEELRRLEENGQIWLRYANNPNGSVGDIAGVFNEKKNVCALMPHPERALHEWMGGTDGVAFFAKR